MNIEDLTNKARKHYIHFLKFTVPKNKNFDHEICYNGKLSLLLNTTRDRWIKLKNLNN